MKIGKTGLVVAAVAALIVSGPAPGRAQVISFDEYGNIIITGFPGFPHIPGFIAPSPPSGAPTLMYLLPFGVTPGDVVLFEPPGVLCNVGIPSYSQCSDVLRFFGNQVWVFSDALDGPEPGVLADGLMPDPFLPFPSIFLPEMGVEGNNGLFGYTPGPGDPGFALGVPFAITYNFNSDGHVAPEPASLVMTFTGFGALAMFVRRRRRAQRDAA